MNQGFKEEALSVTPDLEHKFELALDLKKLDIAHKVLLESDAATSHINGSNGAGNKYYGNFFF